MMKLNPRILMTLTCLCFSPPALSELRWPEFPSKNKPLSVSLQTEFFRTHSNYTQFGQYVDLPNENFFQYVAFSPSISYSPFLHYINFDLFANSFYASSKTLNTRRDVPFQPTVLGGGARFYYRFQSFYSGFELRGGLPLSGNFQSSDDMILGDGAYFVEPGLWFLFQPSKMFYVYANTAFRYRMSSPSDILSGLLFNRLGGVLQTRNMDAGISIDSFFSLLPDQFTDQPEKRWELIKKTNGGSYKFYSVNPSVFSWTTWMELKFQPVFTKIYFNLDTLGQNYAKGFSFGLITKLKWSTKSSIIDRKRNTMRFDFNEEDFGDSTTKPDSKEESYFEEKEDPYNRESINKELKQELRSLRY